MRLSRRLATAAAILLLAASTAGAQEIGMEALFERPDGTVAVESLTESQVAENGEPGDSSSASGLVLADSVVGRDSAGRPAFQDLQTGNERVASMDELGDVSNLLAALSDSEPAGDPAASPPESGNSTGSAAVDEALGFDGVELAMADTRNGTVTGGAAPAGPRVFHVKASAEGLIGARTASGKRIKTYTEAVALPHPKVLGRQTLVTFPTTGRSVSCPVLDVGPWNTSDAYWERADGKPQAQSGRDRSGRRTNRAGIDLFNGTWYKLLGLRTYNRSLIENTTGMVDWNFED